MSDQAGRTMIERGFTKVMNLKGGMSAWKGALEQ
jgi:rhodanese-related sulfurtransferase